MAEAYDYDMSSDDECQELEIVTTQQNQLQPESNQETPETSNIPAPRPENDETFAAMIVERLKELTHEQRLIAQNEIVRILNQWNQPGDTPQASQQAPAREPASAPPASQLPQLQVLQPLYGINYLQPRRPQDGAQERRQDGGSDSPEIEWGDIFTPHNNLSP